MHVLSHLLHTCGRRRQRDAAMKYSPSDIASFNRDIAAVRHQYLLHQGQADAVATRFGGEERYKDAVQVVYRDTAASVADANMREAAIASCIHRAADAYQLFGGIRIQGFDRIANQVEKDPPQQRFVGSHFGKLAFHLYMYAV